MSAGEAATRRLGILNSLDPCSVVGVPVNCASAIICVTLVSTPRSGDRSVNKWRTRRIAVICDYPSYGSHAFQTIRVVDKHIEQLKVSATSHQNGNEPLSSRSKRRVRTPKPVRVAVQHAQRDVLRRQVSNQLLRLDLAARTLRYVDWG